jgi:hypothetical protein
MLKEARRRLATQVGSLLDAMIGFVSQIYRFTRTTRPFDVLLVHGHVDERMTAEQWYIKVDCSGSKTFVCPYMTATIAL